jgi:amino acid transporter
MMAERLTPGNVADIETDMRLRPGQVGFGAVLFQSLTHIALIFALTVGVQGAWVGELRAVIYVVPTFAGFETAAVLAEESRDPRRNIPRAVL